MIIILSIRKALLPFSFLRFNNSYLKAGRLPAENVQRLEFILQNTNRRPGCILKNQTDKQLVKPLIEAIGRGHMNRNIYNQELIQHLINSRIVVLARNIAKYQELGVSEQTDMRVFDMLQYIQTNIYEPAKLCPEQLSRTFGISPADLSRYFKQHTGETVQQYIAGYITRLIVHRLQHSGK